MLAAVTKASTLSEHDAKTLLAQYGVPVSREFVVDTVEGAVDAATELGHPVVLKLSGAEIAHKTELGGVRVGLVGDDSVRVAASELLDLGPQGVELLVAEHIRGNRELIAGVATDPQFGRTLMFGVGGILTELVGDVVFRLLPATDADLDSMLDDLDHSHILGEFRGEPAVDRDVLLAALRGLATCALERDDIDSIDINPFIISGSKAIAVDALVVLR